MRDADDLLLADVAMLVASLQQPAIVIDKDPQEIKGLKIILNFYGTLIIVNSAIFLIFFSDQVSDSRQGESDGMIFWFYSLFISFRQLFYFCSL